jgi:hypothetical protein
MAMWTLFSCVFTSNKEDPRKGDLMAQSIISAFGNGLSEVFSFIPRLVGFLVILFVGWLVGIAVAKVLTALLRKIGFERLSNRIGMTRMEQRMGIKMDSAQILGKIAFWFIFLIFLVPATDALGVPTISNVLNMLVDYVPNIFVAVLVLFLGTILGVLAGDIIRGTATASKMGHPEILGNIVRWAIIGFACLIALEQLKIAPALITVLFAAVVGGLALAFGLSFGLGGRDSAQRLLSRSEGRLMTSQPYDPNQIVQQARGDLAHTEQVGYNPQASSTAYGGSGTQKNVPPAPQSYDTSTGYDNPTSSPQRPPQRPSTPRP